MDLDRLKNSPLNNPRDAYVCEKDYAVRESKFGMHTMDEDIFPYPPGHPVKSFFTKELKEISPKRLTRSILEIGSGCGRWSAQLRECYSTYVGLEPVEYRRRIAENIWQNIWPDIRFAHPRELATLGTFDAILVVDVFQHLPMMEVVKILSEVKSHLHTYGKILIFDACLYDNTLEECEAIYFTTRPEHMIPKPLDVVKHLIPEYEWRSSGPTHVLTFR